MATYKIIGFDETAGVLIIQFDTNMAPLTVDVPFDENGQYITGDALDHHIQGFIPVWHLDRLARISSGVANVDAIKALVETPEPVTQPSNDDGSAEALANADMWSEHMQEKAIAKALVKFGVLQSDPTEVEVTRL